MFGFDHHDDDDGKLPIFVHSLQSAEAFELAQKVWQVNGAIQRVDPANNKEFERFRFSNPDCIVWLQRDRGRSDTFELILIWDKKEVGITEVYTVSAVSGTKLGDDARARELLERMLTAPATVPVNQTEEQ
jgi:hypothetical protein